MWGRVVNLHLRCADGFWCFSKAVNQMYYTFEYNSILYIDYVIL